MLARQLSNLDGAVTWPPRPPIPERRSDSTAASGCRLLPLKNVFAASDASQVSRFAFVLGLAGLASVTAPAAASAHASETAASKLFGAWNPEPTVIAASILAVALFGRGFLALRRRGRHDHAGWTHACPFLLGMFVLTLALVSPLDAAAEDYLLSAHMLQHVLIGDLAPALLVLGIRGPLTLFAPPAPILRRGARTIWLRRMLGFVLRPKQSFAVWALTLAIWHVPAIYDAALARTWLHDLEHASFLASGLLVWSLLIDPARRGELDLRGRILYAGALFGAAHLFIHPVLLSGSAVYGSYTAQPHRLLGLSPLADQHWAGLVMTVEQMVTLGVFLLVLLRHGASRAFVDRTALPSRHRRRQPGSAPHHRA
jgi:putative membrane protein